MSDQNVDRGRVSRCAYMLLAPLAGILPIVSGNAALFTWVGAAQSYPVSGSYSNLFTSGPDGRFWGDESNWSGPTQASTIPSANDTVLFPNNMVSAVVCSATDRKIKSLSFDATIPVDFDFSGPANQQKTLELTDGILWQTTPAPVNFVGGILNSNSDAQWNIQGKWSMYGTMAAAGKFTKFGAGEIVLWNQSLVAGEMDIQEGKLTVKTSQLSTGALTVGDSNGSFATIDFQTNGFTPALRVGQLATYLQAGSFATNELSIGLASITLGNVNQVGTLNTSKIHVTAPNGGLIQGDNGSLKTLSNDILFYGIGKVTVDTLIDSPHITLSDGVSVILRKNSPDNLNSFGFTGDGTLTMNSDTALYLGSSTLSVSGNATATVNGSMVLPFGASLPVSVEDGSSLTVFTPMTEYGVASSTIRKFGAGTFYLNNNASECRIGTLDVQAGVMRLGMLPGGADIKSSLMVGTLGQASPPLVQWTRNDQITDTGTITLNAGTIDLNGAVERVSGVTVRAGTIQTGNGVLNLAGNMNVDLAGRPAGFTGKLGLITSERAISTAAGTDYSIEATISGAGLLKTGDGVLRILGTGSNSQQGTRITDGTLLLGKTAGVNATGVSASGISLDIGDAGLSVLDPQPIVKYLASNQLPDTSKLQFNGGTLDLNGFSETVAGINVAAIRGAISTPGGTLTLNGNIDLSAGLIFSGNLNLGGGERTLTAPTGLAASFAGKIDNGTFTKSGGAITVFNNVGATAALKLNGDGNRSAGATRFNGLQGSGALTIADGSFASIVTSGGSFNYSGVLAGQGEFIKQSPGTQVLSGAAANTIIGTISVNGGTLLLNKSTGAAMQGPLNIGTLGNVETQQNNQLGFNTDAIVLGQMFLQNTTQTFQSLSVTSGGIYSGTLQTSGGIDATDALFTSIAVKIDSGGLVLGGATSAQLRGSVKGASYISGTTNLLVEADASPSTSDLIFSNNLSLASGAHLYLFPSAPSSPAVIDINGSLLVGAAIGIGSVTMIGQATVDLSAAGSLSPGRYNLIDFSAQPYTVGISSGYAALGNFNTIPPSTPGSFAVVNHVLVYDAIPEPACLPLLLTSLALLRRKRAR